MNIYTTNGAFAALKSNGQVIVWGSSGEGGSPSASGTTTQLDSGVVSIVASHAAFSALKSDGSMISWGGSGYGATQGTKASLLTSGVVKLFSSSQAFAALKNDGSGVATLILLLLPHNLPQE